MASKDEQPKRGGFVSVGDLALDMPDVPVLALRQARHFTRLDQVTQLVAAREAVAELGFMARLLALCSLPRTNPKQRNQYEQTHARSSRGRLPNGSLSEAVRTQRRELVLGRSLSRVVGQHDRAWREVLSGDRSPRVGRTACSASVACGRGHGPVCTRGVTRRHPPRYGAAAGPVGAAPDDVLVGHIRRVLDASPFHGEGYRKAWAKLRVEGMRTSKERVRRLMREHDLQGPHRAGHAHGPRGRTTAPLPPQPPT